MIYVDTHSCDPAFNFAVEEYFMTEKKREDTVFLFWHTAPTVMLGKFQNSYKELNLPAIAADHVQVVRRVTGGGAIYTDLGGWQFSFIRPEKSEQIDFGRFMDPIVDALATLGVSADHNSRNDLAINGKKFSGNAQATRGNFTLHHGSLLYQTDFSKMSLYLRPSVHKLKAKGIESVRGRTTNLIDYMPQKWSSEVFADQMIAALLKNGAVSYKLTDEDLVVIDRIADEKFRSWAWTYGKNPQFTIEHSRVTDGGELVAALSVEQGNITQCELTGDFFSAADVDQFLSALTGQPYTRAAIAQVLTRFPNLIYNITNDEILEVLIEL